MSDAFERAADRAESEYRRRGKERNDRIKRKSFQIHATVFVAVQVLLVVVWALQWQLGGSSHPWFLYVLLGWGVGLAAHYAAIRPTSKDRELTERAR
jgi:hypothetical protein